jgi:hypothetical protein
MGGLAFEVEQRCYAFLQVRARAGAGVEGATPRRRPACAILTDSLAIATSCSRSVRLCAYATKMRVPLLRADSGDVPRGTGRYKLSLTVKFVDISPRFRLFHLSRLGVASRPALTKIGRKSCPISTCFKAERHSVSGSNGVGLVSHSMRRPCL